jgi:hypothetical protein
MIRLALKMLFGDRGRYLLLVSGLTFSTLLMTQFPSVFCGLMTWTYANMFNSRAHLWVMDPKAEQSLDSKPLRDTDVNRVRSVARAVGYLKGDTSGSIPMAFVRIEPYVVPKRSLTGASTERVDTRVLQVIYRFAKAPDRTVYVGQQLDLYIEE